MSYDDTNRGALFNNDKKESANHPDYTGKINVDGKELRLAAWIKEGKSGKFMSLAVSEFQKNRRKPESASPGADEFDDDVPF